MRVRGEYERLDDTLNSVGVRGDSVAAVREIPAAGPRKAVGLPPEDFGISGSATRPEDYGAVDSHDNPSAGFNGVPPKPSLASLPHASAFSTPSRTALNAPKATQATEDRSLEAIKKALEGPRRQWFAR